jgi:hypothetical protein
VAFLRLHPCANMLILVALELVAHLAQLCPHILGIE